MDKKTEQDLRVTMMWLQRAVDDLYKKDLTKKKVMSFLWMWMAFYQRFGT